MWVELDWIPCVIERRMFYATYVKIDVEICSMKEILALDVGASLLFPDMCFQKENKVKRDVDDYFLYKPK